MPVQRSRPRVRSGEKKRERKARTQDKKDLEIKRLWVANKRYAVKGDKLEAKIKDIGLSDDALKNAKKNSKKLLTRVIRAVHL